MLSQNIFLPRYHIKHNEEEPNIKQYLEVSGILKTDLFKTANPYINQNFSLNYNLHKSKNFDVLFADICKVKY